MTRPEAPPSRPRWPLVVRVRDIEGATAADAGRFARRALAPVPVPPPASTWLATFCANTVDPVVALTLDDGPHPEHTPRILEVLAAHTATATFFVLADQVERYPGIARRIADEGHELALHGSDHRSLRTLGTIAAVGEVRRARARVEAATGQRMRFYRPPYGAYTAAQAVGIRVSGLELVVWSIDSHDWESDDVDGIVATTAGRTVPGGVVLLHDNRGDAHLLPPAQRDRDHDRAAVVEGLLTRLEQDGYSTLTVGGLLARYQRVRSVAAYGIPTRDA